MVAQAKTQSSTMQRAFEQPVGMVKEYPISSTVTAFGIGMGVGVLVAYMLSDSIMHLARPEPTFAEKLSRQISDSLAQVLPESLARQLPRY